MAESEKKRVRKEGREGREGREGNERKRFSYLKMRAKEIRAELAANKKESEELRKKMGMGGRTRRAAKGDAGEGGEE